MSYSRVDEGVVKALARGLEAAGRDVWFDNDLGGGEVWWTKILQSIRESEVVVFGLSDDAWGSKPCRSELAYAEALERSILPIKVGPVSSLRANPLSQLQTLEFRPADAHSAFEIIGAVDDALLRPHPLPATLPPEPQMPYKYLISLNEQIDAQELGHQAQVEAVYQLRKAYREETDASVHRDIVGILRSLKSKPWTTLQAAAEIDEAMDWIDRQQVIRRRLSGVDGPGSSGGPVSAAETPAATRSTSVAGPTSAGAPEPTAAVPESAGTPGEVADPGEAADPGVVAAPEVAAAAPLIAAEDARRRRFEERLADRIGREQDQAKARQKQRRVPPPQEPSRAGRPGEGPSSSKTAGEEIRPGAPGPGGTGAASPEGPPTVQPTASEPLARQPQRVTKPDAGESASDGATTFRLSNPSLRPPGAAGAPIGGGATGASSTSGPVGGWRSGTWQGPGAAAAGSRVSGDEARVASVSQTASSSTGWAGVSTVQTMGGPTSGSLPRPPWVWCFVALPTVLPGLVALYWAGQVGSRVASGDLAGARHAVALARGWGIAGAVALGILVILVALSSVG